MTERSMSSPVQTRGEILVVPNAEALAQTAADHVIRVTRAAVEQRGRAFVALSGGSTPRRMGELLASAPYRDQVPWPQLEIFWGDERWVPESSPESNAGVARRTFLDHVPIAPAQIYPFPTDGDDPSAAAAAYASAMRRAFDQPTGIPRFDLILLGMGDDGHTASLFPHTAALTETQALAVANEVPKLNTVRLTLTLPVLNAGREVLFLIGGAGKAETLAAVLEGPVRLDDLPSQRIQPGDGRLIWLVDEPAAAHLTTVGATGG